MPEMIQYTHVNIVAEDWRALADFYIRVFGCKLKPPVRDHKGEWLSRGTGVKNAALAGAHLILPGFADDGPTLEIFQFAEMADNGASSANRKGLRHIAFRVDDVGKMMESVIQNGGSCLGEIVSRRIDGVGTLTFVYVHDPEGNIIEIQSHKPE